VDRETPYIVRELLEGEDLEKRLERLGRLSPTAVAALLKPVARALTAAHAAGIVHRDLKPANLFLARVDDEEVVKVLDFGLARRMAPSQTSTGNPADEQVAGTLRYMSPEQLRNDPALDHRSDLWSLAVVTYRALTGQFPYPVEAVHGLLRGQFQPPSVPASRLVAELGLEVDAFFERGLSLDPARRFGSARELAAAFTALVEAKQPMRAAKILVVDDEPDVELMMRQRLRRRRRRSAREAAAAPGYGCRPV
jgi:serine/threonine protein kinase